MVSLAVCLSEETKKRKRGEESVAIWFAEVSSRAATVMAEGRRGGGEKRKMDDLVSSEEKRRDRVRRSSAMEEKADDGKDEEVRERGEDRGVRPCDGGELRERGSRSCHRR
ncbi:hypothetical protein HAX54_047915 [Datura stramonium]|uniref:Uncharacterized protein n=1 Tax=Datura stramonium TaxID=4076 RepID=A0ABS8STV8_DATST|nr:hypothetical protein [Datura stramonium]